MVTQLTNTISSVSGRIIYVSSDDFNATDSLDNRGNSPLRPFKNIQRALLEIARYSYVPGFNNDRFSQFTIQVATGVYFIDNRPGLSSEDEIVTFGFDKDTGKWNENINVDITDRDNIFWKFNTREGGCILPRGCSVIGNDLRHVIIKPLYVPDPVDENIPRTSLFNVTGECHFFGFTIRDGEVGQSSPLYDRLSNTGKVYYDKDNYGLLQTPLYSHHKITVFIFAAQNELDLYYKKVAKAFSSYEPTINVEGEFDERIEESRIVGPLSDVRSIQSIELRQTPGFESSTNIVVTLTVPHDYFEGQFVSIANTGIDDLIEGVFRVYSVSSINNKEFTYRIPYASAAIGVGYALDPQNPTIIDLNSQPVALNSNAVCNAEIDTTESASPYVLNCSLRSDWGMCGMWADGLRTSGFKSMVVAQYTGISLQKDDRAFIRYDENTNTWKQASLSSAFSPDVEHTKGDSYWKTDWRTFHIRGSEGAFIQCVSVFAIGQSDQFLMESGADFSITNSNSNFGDTALHAKGFQGSAFVKDQGGYISHIVPPQELDDSLENQTRVSYYTIDVQNTIADSDNSSKIYIGGEDNTDPYKRPAANVKGQRIGNKYGERLSVRLDPEIVGGTEVFDAEVFPNGFVKYLAKPFNTTAVESVTGDLAKSFDAANLIEANRTLIQEEAFGWMLEKYPKLRSSKEVFPDRSDFQTEAERGKLFDAVSLITQNKRFIQDETLKYILNLFPSLKNTKLFPQDTDGEINKQERESSKCFRDIGFFLDSLTSDLRRGGNREIIDFVDFYKDATGIIHVTNELEETKTAYSYAANAAIAAMRNFNFDIENVISVNDSATNYSRFFDAANLIRQNKRLIQDESIKYILNKYPFLRHSSKVFPLDTDQDITINERRNSPCHRDIGYFIDALVKDLEVGGNNYILEFANFYKDSTGIAHITKEIVETKDAYSYAATLATAAMRNFDFTVRGVTYDNGSKSHFRFFDAANLIKSNRRLIQDETVKYIIDKYPNIARSFKVFPDNDNGVLTEEGRRNSSCFRDIGYFVDALVKDLENGGNGNIHKFVDFYREGNDISFISNELEETKNAYSYAATLATAAMRNFDFVIDDCEIIANSSIVNVGDNSGIPLGMTVISSSSFPREVFKVVKIIDNNKIELSTTDDSVINSTNNNISGVSLEFSVTSGDFDIDPIVDTEITRDISTTPRCSNVAQRITELLQDAKNLLDGDSVILDPEDLTSIVSINVRDNSIIPIGMKITGTNIPDNTFVGRLLGNDRIMAINNDRYVTNYSNYPEDLQFSVMDDKFDIDPIVDTEITRDNSTTPRCSDVASRISTLSGQVNDFFDGRSISQDSIDIGYLDVGDNSGLMVGMNISGDGIGTNKFVGKLVGNDKVIVSDSEKRLINLPITGSQTLTFSIESPGNAYFNESSPIRDEGITEDSPVSKCSDVAARIISLEQNVLDLFSGKTVIVEDAEDNAITSPCYRDIGYFVDALVGDLKTGGNLRSIKVGETYRNGNSINFIEGEIEETIKTYEYAKNVAIAAMRNFSVTLSGITTTKGSSTVNVGNTSGLIVGMRVIDRNDRNDTIPEDTVIKDIISDTEIILGQSGSTPKTGSQVNAKLTYSAAVFTFTAPEFLVWSDERISKDESIIVDTKVSPVCNDIAIRINSLSKVMIDIIMGRSGVEEEAPIDLSEVNSQAGRGIYLDAANLIESNRELIQDAALGRIKYTNPSFEVPNDKDDSCKRDIGFLVDALVSDIRIGGNLNTLRIGEFYKEGNEIVHIEDEIEETKEAFEYVGNLAISAMRNFTFSTKVNIKDGSTTAHNEIAVGDVGYELVDGMLISGEGIAEGTYIRKNLTNHRLVYLYTDKDFSIEYSYTGIGGSNISVIFSIDSSNTIAYSERSITTDTAIAIDESTPKCNAVKERIRSLLGALQAVLSTDNDVVQPQRIDPDSNITSQTSRTTIFEIDTSGIGTSDPHNLQTGTPVRLVPRPKFNDSFGTYEKVDPRLVRLPKGFESNKIYYVIAPGRKTQPYDYSQDSENGLFGQDKTSKLMLAETKEAAIVGLYIYSPEGDSVDPNVEIDLYQFVSDEDYDLERYKCIGVTGSIKINTDIGHNFDIPSTEENATKVFFRTIPGSKTTRLPEVSDILKRDQSISRDGRLRNDVEFYVRPDGIKVFSIYKTLNDAINDSEPIGLNYQNEEFNVFFNKRRSPLRYEPSYGKWYLGVKRTDDFIVDRIRKRDYSGRLRTTDSWFSRIADNRDPQDRIYRLRYVIPNYNINISPPTNGFVLKARRDTFTGLLPQKVLVRGKVTLRADVTNSEKITITRDEFNRRGFTEEIRYDPYRKSSLGDLRVRLKTYSNVISTIQSARFVEIAGLEYTEIILMEPEVDTSISTLKNSTFTTIEITQPQGGDGQFNDGESITWNNSSKAIVQRYIKNDSTRRHYLILKDVNGNLENDSSIVFSQGDVTANIKGDPDFGRSISIGLKLNKDLDEYYYSKNNASVYTITPGDTFNDSSGNSFTIESVEDVDDIENTYYIYTSDTIQRHIPNQQDGIYYLNILKGDVSPFPTSAGVANNFKQYEFSQPIGSLYPVDFSNDPIWFKYAGTSQAEKDYVRGLKDPLPTSSVADNFLHGLVTVNDIKLSATKEAILDLLDNSLFRENNYLLEAQNGNALSGAEDRLIPIMGDDQYVSRERLYVELRRYSIARAGNHTFEYLGFGPGNYSTALPIRQQRVITPLENFYSQSKKEGGGVVFYTGGDSTGGFYIGNRRYDTITNDVEVLESAVITSDTEGDSDIITDLVETFISPVTFNENITVLGGNGSDPSLFESPVIVSVQAVDLSQVDYPLIIRSNVDASKDDRLLDRTNFRPLTSGDIVIGKNLVQSASFRISPRSFGQGYSIRTHVTNGFASNSTPLPNQAGRLADFGSQPIKSGDIVLRGKNIEEFGSIGWVYTNRFLDSIPLTEINNIEFNTFSSTVIIRWSGSRRNEQQGVIQTSEITFNGFTGDYSFLNGTWTVVLEDREYENEIFSVSDNLVVLEGFNVPEVDTLTQLGSVSIRVSIASWKEIGVIGSEAIRTNATELGNYGLGINTLSRSNNDDYINGYVTSFVSPKFNLDVVGDALITGESIVYNSGSDLNSRTISKVKDALLVGYNSSDILSDNRTFSSGFRVSSKDNGGWKVGINLPYDIVDTGYDLLVNGPVQFRNNILQLTNNVVIGTSDVSGTVSIFDESIDSDADTSDSFVGTINIGNDASTVNISASSESTNNEINIGRGSDLSENASIVNLKTSSINVYGNARFGSSKDLDSKLIFSTSAGEVSLFDSVPSTLSLGNAASSISIGSFVGDTVINNRLKVASEFEISGSITLVGGSDASSYLVERTGNILGTTPISHIVGDVRNTNVDIAILDREFVLELDVPGGGNWIIGDNNVFYFKINTNRNEINEYNANQFNERLSDNVRVGDYFLIEGRDRDGNIIQKEIVRVTDVTNLLGDSEGVRSVRIERNPLNVNGLVLPTEPYEDVRTKAKKVSIIRNSSYLIEPIDSNDNVVSLGTFSGSVKPGDYFLLSGLEFVEVIERASSKSREFKVLEGRNTEGEDLKTLFGVDTVDKVVTIDGDIVNITGDTLNLSSEGMTFSIDDDNPVTGDIFRVESESRTIDICADILRAKIGPSAPYMLNLNSEYERDVLNPIKDFELLREITFRNSDNSIVITKEVFTENNNLNVGDNSDLEVGMRIEGKDIASNRFIANIVGSDKVSVKDEDDNSITDIDFYKEFRFSKKLDDGTISESYVPKKVRVISRNETYLNVENNTNLEVGMEIIGGHKRRFVKEIDGNKIYVVKDIEYIGIDSDEIQITSGSLNFNISDMSFTVPSGMGDVFKLTNNPNKEVFFDTDTLGAKSKLLNLVAQDLNIVIPRERNEESTEVFDSIDITDLQDNVPSFFKIDGSEKLLEVNSSTFNVNSEELNITGKSLNISGALTLDFSFNDDEIFTFNTVNKIGKIAVDDFDFEVVDFDISGSALDIESNNVTLSNENFRLNVDPTGNRSIFSIILDQRVVDDMGDPSPINQFTSDGVDYDINDSIFDIQTTSLIINSDFSRIESDSLDLKIGIDPNYIFTINSSLNDNKGSVVFNVGDFDITSDTLDLESNNLTISGENLNIDSDKVVFSNKDFSLDIAPDPDPGNPRKSLLKIVLDSEPDIPTKTIDIDIDNFDVKSNVLDLEIDDFTIKRNPDPNETNLLTVESNNLILRNDNLKIDITPTGNNSIFSFDSNKTRILDNGSEISESVVNFDVTLFELESDNLVLRAEDRLDINSPYSEVNIINFNFNSSDVKLDIKKVNDKSLVHINSSTDLIKFENVNLLKIESTSLEIDSNTISIGKDKDEDVTFSANLKEISLEVIPDSSKERLINIQGDSTTRLIEFNLENYNLISTNASIVSDYLNIDLKNIVFDVSLDGGDTVFRLDSKVDNKLLSINLDTVTIDGDNYTILGEELNIRSDTTTFSGDLVKFEGDRVEFDFTQFFANVGNVFNINTDENTISFDTDIIKLNARVNLDIDAINMDLNVTSGAVVNIKDLDLDIDEGFIDIDSPNKSITLNVNDLIVNVNDDGEIIFEQLKVGISSNPAIDIKTGLINSSGLFTHVGYFETASALGDERNTYFSIDVRGNSYINNSLSIGNESILGDEKFKVDLDGDKEFVIKDNGSINAFGLENFFNPNGGKRIERVNASTLYPNDRLPYKNIVYFFNPTGLQGLRQKRFNLPENPINGDHITWITTGILHNNARLIMGGSGDVVQGDSEGVMFNVPYASFTLYYVDGGWWLADLP